MAWDGQYLSTTFKAGADLDTEGHAGIAIVISTGLPASNGKTAGGILLPHSKPKSGEHGSVGYMGALRFRAGAAVAANALLSVTTSGYLITKPASGSWCVGRALEGVASGGIGTGVFNFAVPAYDATSS